MAKSPEEMMESMIAGLVDKTGKSLDAWRKLVRDRKLGKHGEIVAFLKKEHGMGHGYANLVAASAPCARTVCGWRALPRWMPSSWGG